MGGKSLVLWVQPLVGDTLPKDPAEANNVDFSRNKDCRAIVHKISHAHGEMAVIEEGGHLVR